VRVSPNPEEDFAANAIVALPSTSPPPINAAASPRPEKIFAIMFYSRLNHKIAAIFSTAITRGIIAPLRFQTSYEFS
jgi:hypothetical protein